MVVMVMTIMVMVMVKMVIELKGIAVLGQGEITPLHFSPNGHFFRLTIFLAQCSHIWGFTVRYFLFGFISHLSCKLPGLSDALLVFFLQLCVRILQNS